MSDVKPYLPSDLDGASFSWEGDDEVYDRVAATVHALADAQKRIAELEELAELVRRSGCSMHTKYANYIGWSERGAVERIRALAKSAKRT